MADSKPTVDDPPTELSPETRVALDMLLSLAGPGPSPAARRAASTVSATDEFAAARVSHPRRGGRPVGEYPRESTVIPELYPGAGVDKTLHQDYLGVPPWLVGGLCTLCGFAPQFHLDHTGHELSLREWHLIDSRNPNGFYADEEPQR